jgi:1,4-alpha-glucan branching enzyme
MMRLDDHGGRIFTLEAPNASVAEVTVDLGGAVRTLAMHRHGDVWTLRLHPGLPCLRYRFRVDGQAVTPDDGDSAADPTGGWRFVRPAA